MNNITKTLVLGIVAAATAFGLTTDAKAESRTLSVGNNSMVSLRVNGRYVSPTIVSTTQSTKGVLTVTKFSSLSSGIYFAKIAAKKAGTATIKARYGKTYYYWNITVYDSGSGSKNTTSAYYIDGTDKISYGRYGTFTLKTKSGSSVLKNSIRWKLSAHSDWLTAAGSYCGVFPTSVKKTSEVLTVSATYNGVTYTKKITVYKNGTYGLVFKTTKKATEWRRCSIHGYYEVTAGTLGTCPSCRGVINW